MTHIISKNDRPPRTPIRITPPGTKYSAYRWCLPFLTQLLAGTAVIYLPALVAHIITLHTTAHTNQAWAYTWVMGAIIILLSLNEYFGYGTAFHTVYLIERDWKLHIATLIPHTAHHTDAGNIIATINKDTRSIAQLYMPFIDACAALPIVLLGTIQLWTLSPLVATTTLTGFLVAVLALAGVSKILEQRADVFRETIGVNTSKASDIATSIRTILGLGAGATMLNRYRESAESVRSAQMHYEALQSWSSALRISLMGFITLLAVGLALRGNPVHGTWTTDIPAAQLITVTGIITIMLGPLWAVEQTLLAWRNSRVALKRIVHLENLAHQPPAPQCRTLPDKLLLPAAPGVHYLNPAAFNTTAENLAQSITEHLRTVHDPHGVLLSTSDATIYAGTLQEHLYPVDTQGTAPHTAELLRITDSEEIAQRLTGADTRDYLKGAITSFGANLSGGQCQRLALARALAHHKPQLVLAEPLNSVDEPSQRFILDQLEKHRGRPGPLEHLHCIYIISTTAQVQSRIDRDNRSPRTEAGA